MSVRLWPRTLAGQLVIVTAVAVLVSNLAVAIWFELGRQQLTESSITDRLIDRAISASTLLASIPARQRVSAAHALGSNAWDFRIRKGRAPEAPMSDAERALAARIQALLPETKTHRTVLVKYRAPTEEERKRPRLPVAVTEITIPLVRGTQLITTFFQPPPAP